MTVHLITVGLSVLRTLSDPARARTFLGAEATRSLQLGMPRIRDLCSAPQATYADEGWNFSGDAADPTAPMIVRHVGAFLRGVDEDANSQNPGAVRKSSAELDGYMAEVAPRDVVPSVRSDDVVILLGSDTPSGRAAAVWTAGLLVAGDFTRVRWVADGLATPPQLEPGLVYLVTVRDLTPTTIVQFVERLGILARSIRASARAAGQKKIHLHLSGGIKAALPYFLAMGDWISASMPVGASARHEDSNEAVPLPVRVLSMPEDELALMRALMTRPGPHPRPDNRDLAGYAYIDRNPGVGGPSITADLTYLGRGLVAFCGPGVARL